MFALLMFDTDWKAEIFKRLDALAEKLGTTAQYLWHVLVKQGYVEGIADLVITVVLLTICFTAYKIYRMCWPRAVNTDFQSGQWVAGTVFPAIAGTLCFIVSLVWFYQGIQALLNPEYWALQKLLESLK